MKKKSIKMAILIPSLSVLIAGIIIMVTVVAVLSSRTANDLTNQLIEARVSENTNEFRVLCRNVYGAVTAVTPIISNYISPDLASNVTSPREDVIDILSKVLLSNSKILGIWTCWEPNAFDGKDSEFADTSFYDATGRFVPYIYKSGSGFGLNALTDYDSAKEGEYYQGALKSGKPYMTDPYPYVVGGTETLMCTISIPIHKDGKVVGVVGADLDLNDFTLLMDAATILEDGYLFTISPGGLIATHPNEELILIPYTELWLRDYGTYIEDVLTNGGDFSIDANLDITGSEVSFLGSGVVIGDTGRQWIICAVVPEKTVTASSTTLLWAIIAIGLALIMLVGITIFLIVRRNLQKLPVVAAAAQKISDGNFDVLIGSNSSDEIADVSNAMLNVKNTVQRLAYDIKNLSEDFKAGALESKMDESAYKGEFQTVAREINITIEGLIEGTMETIGLLAEFGDGNFDVAIKQYPGKKEILTTSFKAMQSNLKEFNDDISSIITGATDGNLDVNIDISKYKGDWCKMAMGINGLLDAVIKPIREAINVLNQLSGGNLNVSVNGNYKGEFETMKSALNNTLTMLTTYIMEISTTLTSLAQNDLDIEIKREYVGEFSAIKTALNTITDKINNVISEIALAAEQVASGAKQISESSMTLAHGATEQASAVEELTSAVSIINDNTKQNAAKAKEAEGLSDSSKYNAAKGDRDMNSMLASMNSIKESSGHISKIIKVIEDISFQTNLLALNAAVEAARAGDHGKGFAVVAEEVRNLAGRSQKAAKETSELIAESINRVNEGAKIASQTAAALRDISSDVSSVADIITGIAESSNEQAVSVGQVTDGLSQVADVTHNNSAVSEEAASASQQLSSQAEMLQGLVSVFNLKKRLK